MSNDPKAGPGIDAAVLAAYIDQRLSPEQRAAVEAQLASDPESYDLLVETMKAQDGLNDKVPGVSKVPGVPGVPVVPFVPKGSVRKVRWVAAAVGVAAVLVLAVRIAPRFTSDPNDTLTAQLVDAVGEERYIDGRLTGGFEFGPRRSITRGGEKPGSRNIALLAVAAEVQRAVQNAATPSNLHAWGVAQLLLGDVDDAIRTLETAVAGGASDETLHSDLAAAYASRAASMDRAEDWPRSLEFAERSIRINSSRSEAYFNKALALEALSLRQQARDAWNQYLERDADSPWADEARRHLADLAEQQGGSGVKPEAFCGAPSPDTLQDKAESLLMAWSLSKPTQSISRQKTGVDLLALGRCIEVRTKDRYFLDLAQAIHNSAAPDRLARAIVLTHEAQQASGVAEFERANSLADEAIALLPAYHPLTVRLAQTKASYLYSMGRMNAVEQLAGSAIQQARSASYEVLRAQLISTVGAVEYASGDLESSAARHEAAAEIWRSQQILSGVATASLYSAEAMRALGDFETSWQRYGVALQHRHLMKQPARRHSTLTSAAVAALNNSLPHVAVSFSSEAELDAMDAGVDGFICEARYLRARAVGRFASSAEALDLLTKAEPYCDRVTEEGYRRRLLAELAYAESEIALAVDPGRAAVAAGTSVALFEGTQSQQRAAALQWLLGRAYRSLGDLDRSLSELQRGIDIVEAQERRVNTRSFRLSFIDNAWDLYGEKTNTLLARGELNLAFDSADLSVGRGRAGARKFAAHELPVHLPEKSLLLAPVVTENQVVVFAVTRAGLRVHVERLRREVITAKSRDFVMLISRRARSEQIDVLGDELSRLLLAPFSDLVGEVDVVFIAADPVLQNIPFGALRIGPPERRSRLIESVSVITCANPTSCVGPSVDPSPHQLTLFQPSSGGEASLPGAFHELKEIAAENPTAQLMEASVDGLRQALSERGIVHYAGHAFVDLRWPERSSILVARRRGGQSERIVFSSVVPPVVRADLIVLSACSTTRGREYRGDGLQAASALLLRQGARHVIGTLWDVEDLELRDVMVAFYRNLARGDSVAFALRQAQLRGHVEGVPISAWAFATLTTQDGDGAIRGLAISKVGG